MICRATRLGGTVRVHHIADMITKKVIDRSRDFRLPLDLGRRRALPAPYSGAAGSPARAACPANGCSGPRWQLEVARRGDLDPVRIHLAAGQALDRLGDGLEADPADGLTVRCLNGVGIELSLAGLYLVDQAAQS